MTSSSPPRTLLVMVTMENVAAFSPPATDVCLVICPVIACGGERSKAWEVSHIYRETIELQEQRWSRELGAIDCPIAWIDRTRRLVVGRFGSASEGQHFVQATVPESQVGDFDQQGVAAQERLSERRSVFHGAARRHLGRDCPEHTRLPSIGRCSDNRTSTLGHLP